ncbi:hypothetical protein COY31_01400 [Candidatus Wolfebacteria bacterium CG_4_10_14_0_2_um_filter_39_18]|uniref:Uncharacterized protein n=1 Tax=Candidatus Wolfebacteria bacterium CG_4_10_14_0_2_um_filter_39_18 TaxID=1975061 RepID=A0A2M7TG09_9BACT|nr:MAG: hypothetical protein COY31_01400 [Candidatus Wolfebacteria bacterium CG_4_10_14_0_2_um_filter_39_18]
MIKSFLENIFLGFNNAALAQGGPGAGGYPGGELANPLGTNNIIQVINNVLNYLIYISVPILAILILVGGFQILTARGEPAKITSGKQTITYAVIGFVIILVSKGVALILLKIMK